MDPVPRRQDVREIQLQESARAEILGQLADGLAHHFNNLLGAVQGFAGLLREDLAEKPEQRRFAERILLACEQGRDLLGQLGTFAQSEKNDSGTVDLVRVARGNANLLSAALPKSVRLQFHYAGDALLVTGSAPLLAQIMAKLCIRASRALGGQAGTVSLTVDRANASELDRLRGDRPRVHARLIGEIGTARDYARLRVADTAPAIPDDVLGALFEPSSVARERPGRTAPGLAFVRSAIESHGGACHVTSRPGEGTIFSIYLPLRADSPEARADRNGVRILIVGDESDIVDRLSLGLERLGYETVGVTDPVEALAAFEEDPGAWDIVIADEAMHEMPGLDLARKLKAARPDIRILLCTDGGDGAKEDVLRATGVDGCLPKPIDAPSIAARLRQWTGAGAGP